MAIPNLIYDALAQSGENLARGMRYGTSLKERKYWSDQAEQKREADIADEREYEKELHSERLKETLKLNDENAKKRQIEVFRSDALRDIDLAIQKLDEYSALGKYWDDPNTTRENLLKQRRQMATTSDVNELIGYAPPEDFREGIGKIRVEQAQIASNKAKLAEDLTRSQINENNAQAAKAAEADKGKSFASVDGVVMSVDDIDKELKRINASKKKVDDNEVYPPGAEERMNKLLVASQRIGSREFAEANASAELAESSKPKTPKLMRGRDWAAMNPDEAVGVPPRPPLATTGTQVAPIYAPPGMRPTGRFTRSGQPTYIDSNGQEVVGDAEPPLAQPEQPQSSPTFLQRQGRSLVNELKGAGEFIKKDLRLPTKEAGEENRRRRLARTPPKPARQPLMIPPNIPIVGGRIMG